jgi:hypothetical protein
MQQKNRRRKILECRTAVEIARLVTLLSVSFVFLCSCTTSPSGSSSASGGTSIGGGPLGGIFPPSVEDTPTGLAVQNLSAAPLQNVQIVVHAVSKQAKSSAAFQIAMPKIAGNAKIVVTYSSLRSSSGQTLKTSSWTPKDWHLSFGDAAAGGSVSGTIQVE